jgi:hypothetical protein
MIEYILSNIICDTYRKVEVPGQGDTRNTKALKLTFDVDMDAPFSLEHPRDYEECRYPKYELLIYGEYNYVGVYLRDVLMHPEEASEWFVLSFHDSCWRTDGVSNFIFTASKHLSTLGGAFRDWYEVVEIDDAFEKKLTELRSRHYDSSLGRRVHPLFKR